MNLNYYFPMFMQLYSQSMSPVGTEPLVKSLSEMQSSMRNSVFVSLSKSLKL